uniref:Uncharacterized protein n=1 Tax=Vespula pensylvanica TaxID=30213 RepID=A0A834UHB4_VESPE|nr:hypothetical protein H0235_002032 [Vespula pensylvanica]
MLCEINPIRTLPSYLGEMDTNPEYLDPRNSEPDQQPSVSRNRVGFVPTTLNILSSCFSRGKSKARAIVLPCLLEYSELGLVSVASSRKLGLCVRIGGNAEESLPI